MIFEAYVIYDGKVVYNIHWERHKDSKGKTSYPAAQRWGERVSQFPNWAIKELNKASRERTGVRGWKGRAPASEDGFWQQDPKWSDPKYRRKAYPETKYEPKAPK